MKCLLLVGSLILFSSLSHAQVPDTDWRPVLAKRTVLRDCSPVGVGEKTVTLLSRGKTVQISPAKNRVNEVALADIVGKANGRPGEVACVKNESGTDSLFIRKDASSPIVEVGLKPSNFPEYNTGSLSGQCTTLDSFPSFFIYKTIGSEHFSDVRRHTMGLIVKPGVRANWPSCMTAIAANGKTIAKFGLYTVGGGWSARYYAGYGCGSGTPYGGSRAASLAQSAAGSPNIYFDFGGACFGPVNASRCVGSGQC